MSLDGIRVNHAALDQACADMHRTVQDIDDRLNRLETELEPLRSRWAGEAQNAYAVAKAQWDGAILEMRDLLDKTEQTVFESNINYRNADARGAAMFGQA